MKDYTIINSKTWDVWAKNGCCWTVPVTHEVFVDAKNGKWDVILTPCKPVPKAWFSPFIHDNRLESVKLLGLACGGGQQMPIFAAIGAQCTVLDYSEPRCKTEKGVKICKNPK